MRRVAVYAGTRAVYGSMVAAAKSLVSHTRMDRVWFLTEDDVFPFPLQDIVKTKNVSGQEWLDPNGQNANTKWTWMSQIRLCLPELFPDEIRVLWLDVDTYVEDDIGDLFDIDLDGNYMAMVEEPVRSKYPFQYYNAGVILMDLARLRKDGIQRKWLRLVNTIQFTAQEQDAINLICQGEILTIGPEYNSAGVITQDAEEPLIRHYAGYLRPQMADVFHRYEKAEWRVI